jgi:hypothetical protein
VRVVGVVLILAGVLGLLPCWRRGSSLNPRLGQRETARAYTASTLGNSPAAVAWAVTQPGGDGGGRRAERHLFGHRSSSPQAAAPAQAVNGHPAPDIPAGDVPADPSTPVE